MGCSKFLNSLNSKKFINVPSLLQLTPSICMLLNAGLMLQHQCRICMVAPGHGKGTCAVPNAPFRRACHAKHTTRAGPGCVRSAPRVDFGGGSSASSLCRRFIVALSSLFRAFGSPAYRRYIGNMSTIYELHVAFLFIACWCTCICSRGSRGPCLKGSNAQCSLY